MLYPYSTAQFGLAVFEVVHDPVTTGHAGGSEYLIGQCPSKSLVVFVYLCCDFCFVHFEAVHKGAESLPRPPVVETGCKNFLKKIKEDWSHVLHVPKFSRCTYLSIYFHVIYIFA